MSAVLPPFSSAEGPETLTVTISDIARGGAGVARQESGRVIFVPYTAPGDRVRVRIVSTEKHYAQGEVLELVEESKTRQKPRCPAFGRCGGCQWQHLPYELQWQIKSRGVLHALARTEVVAPEKFEEFPAERIWEYRNRVQLRGSGDRLGFFAAGSNARVDLDRCDIARPEINASWEETRREGLKLMRPYKVELEAMPDGSVRKTWNAPHAAAGFRQVHDDQNAKLQSWVAREYGGLEGQFELLDLYGGSGNLSLGLAQSESISRIECVDLSSPRQKPRECPQKLNFRRTSVLNWLLRRCVEVTPSARRLAILDPPREGLAKAHSEIAGALERLGAERLIAVGCDPDNWSRDVSRFIRRGWVLEKAAAFDFFPQTPHVESVALLTRAR